MRDRFLVRVLLGSCAFAAYVFLIFLYLHNESNRHLFGIVIDSLGLTGVTILFLLLFLHISSWHPGPGYFRLRRIESSTRLYSRLGVGYFKRVIERYPVPASTRRIQPEGRSQSELQSLDVQMRSAEEVHLLGFLINLALAALFGLLRDSRFFLWLSVFNVIVNLYPIFVQRYNRSRVQTLLQRMAARDLSK